MFRRLTGSYKNGVKVEWVIQKLIATLCLPVAILLGGVGVSFALPSCPADSPVSNWSDCFGIYTINHGNWTGFKYVGEFRNGKRHGLGTLTNANGQKVTGYFRQGNKVNSSQYVAAEVREQISRCWNILGGIKAEKLIDIKVTINLTKNGALEKSPIILNPNLYKRDLHFRIQAESVMRAFRNPKCVPLKLPSSLYDLWRKITLEFSTRNLLK